ncbi:hypothetical protein D3C75_584570 [compost metagenome]
MGSSHPLFPAELKPYRRPPNPIADRTTDRISILIATSFLGSCSLKKARMNTNTAIGAIIKNSTGHS